MAIKKSFSSMLKDFFIGLAAKGHGPTLYMDFMYPTIRL